MEHKCVWRHQPCVTQLLSWFCWLFVLCLSSSHSCLFGALCDSVTVFLCVELPGDIFPLKKRHVAPLTAFSTTFCKQPDFYLPLTVAHLHVQPLPPLCGSTTSLSQLHTGVMLISQSWQSATRGGKKKSIITLIWQTGSPTGCRLHNAHSRGKKNTQTAGFNIARKRWTMCVCV